VIALDVAEVAAAVGGRVVPSPTAAAGSATVPPLLERVVTDTRDPAVRGALFVALTTDSGDGHAHLAAAARAGAAAALVSEGALASAAPSDLALIVVDDTWRALRELAVAVHRRVHPTTIAITGSFGKTTTKDLTLGAVGSSLRAIGAPGSFNNELGVPLTMLLVGADTEVLVAEVGARHVGDIAEMAALLEPHIAIVTAVAGVHLEVFGTIDAIARTKRELVEALRADGTAVLNADDPRVAAMAAHAPAAVTFSAAGAGDVVARAVRLDPLAHAIVEVDGPWGATEVRVPLPGRHHVPNVLAALAAAGLAGVPMDAAARGIAGAATSPWRCEVTRADDVTIVNDAYNASPDTVEAALALLEELPASGRRIAVLGGMAELGDASEDAHRGVGAAVARHAIDELVVVAGAEGIAEGARAAGFDAERIHAVADADAAIELVAATVGPGDVVLVKASRVVGLERVAAALGAPAAGARAR
jgi:UDP-N-acetylmuramoyl-tripeptide--D-alanyl-D-alanine ligase